jgi:hypothetical protein
MVLKENDHKFSNGVEDQNRSRGAVVFVVLIKLAVNSDTCRVRL